MPLNVTCIDLLTGSQVAMSLVTIIGNTTVFSVLSQPVNNETPSILLLSVSVTSASDQEEDTTRTALGSKS
jgi:hypothetical protein